MCGATSRQVPFRKEKLKFRVFKKVPWVINVCFSGHFSCDIAQIHAVCEEEKKKILTCTVLTQHKVNGAMWPV